MKAKFSAIGFVCCALFLAFQIVYATKPTVTATSIATRPSSLNIKGYQVYQFTFAMTPAALDTGVIYLNTSQTASTSSIVQWADQDSVIAYHFYTTEATADSVQFVLRHQISGKASPSTDSDWTTVQLTDSITDATSAIKYFRPKRYGLFYRYRLLVCEDTTGAGETEQGTGTNTVRVLIPL